MAFRHTYEEIREMMRRGVLDVTLARAILRKSGFRPGGIPGNGGAPILSLNPTITAGCPKPPYDSYTSGMEVGERDAFYETVELAETGDAGALEAMRGYLIDFGLEDFVVEEGVMPLLGYDYAGGVFTFTLDEEVPCPIEVDIAPPAGGFWEQYKVGDTRFSDRGITLASGQNYKFLVKSLGLDSSHADERYPSFFTNLNGHGTVYPECPETGGLFSTHYGDAIDITDLPRFFQVVGYRANFGTPGVFPIPPQIWLTNDRLLDNPVSPTYDDTGQGNGPPFGVIGAESTAGLSSPFTAGGLVSLDRAEVNPLYRADAAWRACGDPTPGLSPVREHSCAIRTNIGQTPESERSSTVTYREWSVHKDAPSGEAIIDWSIDPAAPGDTVFRYSAEWPTFDVVAVRMGAEETPLAPGTYFHPLNLPHYITKWDVSASTESRMTAVVAKAALGAVLRPVWAPTREEVLSGDWEYFAAGVPTDDTGFLEGEWGEMPEGAIAAGEAFVGFVLEVSEEVDALVFGVAEVQVR